MKGTKRKTPVVESSNKVRKISLSLKERRGAAIPKSPPKPTLTSYGDKPLTRFVPMSSPELDKCKKKSVCDNTRRALQWAFKVFNDWIAGVDFNVSDLWCDNGERVCQMLSKFVAEARQKKGSKPYTPKTLLQLLINLQSVAYENNPQACHFMDEKNVIFQPLHNVLNNISKKLLSDGVGAEKKQGRVIEVSEENALWDKKVMGYHSPSALLNAIFYYCGLFYCLRGGKEHRALKYSQFTLKDVVDPKNPGEMTTCVVYNEHGSKNHQGGSHQVHVDNKCVTHYEDQSLGERCFVNLFRCYISKLPEGAIKDDIFYCKPKPNWNGDKDWYEASPVGHNLLGRKLKDMFMAAELNTLGVFNHSLRATSISRMYERGVPEKIIMERSGHQSVGGVRSYERTTELQKKEVCETLSDITPALGLLKNFDNVIAQPCGFKNPLEEGKFQFKDVHGCTFNFTINN